jgi:diacylglycerol kinase family enzyme
VGTRFPPRLGSESVSRIEPQRLPREASRVLISVNPIAGRRDVAPEIERLAQLLCEQDFHAEILTDLAEVCTRANEAAVQGRLRALIGVGGDGTAAELVNRTNPGVPLALYPAGTSNLLARQLGLPADPESVCRMVAAGHLVQLDSGRASGRLFLLMVGCGFDAEVVRKVHAARAARGGGHLSYWSYLKPILQSIRSYQYPELRVYCDQQDGGSGELRSAPISARWAFVFNLPRYGWGLRLAPRAMASDGVLDLCTFGGGSVCRGLWYTAAAQLGRHERLADCQTRQVQRVRITAEEPVAYQLDGDPGGLLPVEIEAVPGRVSLLVPRPEPTP